MSSIPTPPYYNKVLSFQEDIIPLYGRDIDAESLPYDTAMGFEPVSPNLHPNDPSSWLDNIPVIGEDKRGAVPKTQHRGGIPLEKKSGIWIMAQCPPLSLKDGRCPIQIRRRFTYHFSINLLW